MKWWIDWVEDQGLRNCAYTIEYMFGRVCVPYFMKIGSERCLLSNYLSETIEKLSDIQAD